MKTVMAIGLCLLPWRAMAGGGAAALPHAAPAHRFLDGHNTGLQALSTAMLGLDLSTTFRDLQVPGRREANPLMKSTAGAVSLKIGGMGAALAVAYAFHKTGHHKAERIVPLVFGIPSGAAAIHNAGFAARPPAR